MGLRKLLLKSVILSGLVLPLAACSQNSFNGSSETAKTSAVATGDGAPPQTTPPPAPPQPSIPGATPLEVEKIAQILMTMTAGSDTEIKAQIDLNQSARTYQASFSEKILGNDIGGCQVTGNAGNFTNLESALKDVRVNDPNGTGNLSPLVTTILKVIFLDGSSLTMQLNLNENGVTSSIPTAQANTLNSYISSLPADQATCSILGSALSF